MGLKRIKDTSFSFTDLTDTAYSDTMDLDGIETLSAEAVIDENTDAAKTFAADTDVNTTTNVITIASHGLPTGMKGQASSTGTLPGGLSTSTDYWVIALTANTIKLASSLANAQAGTGIDLTTVGSAGATHTFTPTAIAGATVVFQKSNKTSQPTASDATWTDDGSAVSITADANKWIEKDRPSWKWARVKFTITAGSMSATVYVLGKGYGNA